MEFISWFFSALIDGLFFGLLWWREDDSHSRPREEKFTLRKWEMLYGRRLPGFAVGLGPVLVSASRDSQAFRHLKSLSDNKMMSVKGTVVRLMPIELLNHSQSKP